MRDLIEDMQKLVAVLDIAARDVLLDAIDYIDDLEYQLAATRQELAEYVLRHQQMLDEREAARRPSFSP